MKHLLFLSFLLTFFLSDAQTKKLFVDRNQKVLKDSTKAAYWVILEKRADSGWYASEYSRDSVLVMEGLYKDAKLKTEEGKFIYYGIADTKNGAPVHRYPFLETVAFYDNGLKTGTWITLQENGDTSKIMTFAGGKNNGLFKEFNEKHIYVEGHYKDDKRVGDWHVYDKNGRLIITDTYVENKVINTVRAPLDSAVSSGNQLIVTGVKFQKATQPGAKSTITLSGTNSDGKLQIAMPDGDFKILAATRIMKIVDENVDGQILLTFIVDPDGSVHDPSIFKGLGQSILDHAIAQEVKNACKWHPAMREGHAIPQSFYCAIEIHHSIITVKYDVNIAQVLNK